MFEFNTSTLFQIFTKHFPSFQKMFRNVSFDFNELVCLEAAYKILNSSKQKNSIEKV